jgi:putative flippase GtrA
VSLWRDPNVRQFVRFAIVGVAQNGTNLAAFALFLALGLPFVLAAGVAAVVALALSFVLNRAWTFPGTDDRTTGRAARFAVVWLSFVAVALPTLALLVDVAHLPRIPAQALIIFVGAPLSYFVQRRWTFRPAQTTAERS